MVPEADHEQDDGRARQAVDRFIRRFGASYRLLAQHAALPLVLTPELLNYLRNKFLRGQVPWVAEVDLLLSDLCQPAGYEQYTMDPAVRAVLLRQLREDPSLGPARMQEVARLLIHYVRHLSRTHAYMDERELDAQQWAAMVVLDDQRETAVRQIAAAFRDCVAPATPGAPAGRPLVDRAEMARLSRITQALAPELEAHRDLVAYATDVARLLADPTGAEATRLYEEGRLHQPTPVLDIDLPALNVFVREVTARTVSTEYRYLDLEAFDYHWTEDGVERFRVRVTNSPVGEQRFAEAEEVTIPPDLRKRLRRLEKRTLDLPGMIALGDDLASLLFPPRARFFLIRTWEDGLDDDEGLRIRLRLEAHALADLPWEYAYIAPPDMPPDRKGPEGFLALDRRVSLVRYEAIGQAPASLEPVGTGPLRLVAFLVSPDATGYPPLDLDAERRIIEQALADIPDISAEFYLDATMESLEDALARETHVFHFAGHAGFEGDPGTAEGSQGGQAFLVLQDQSGQALLFPANRLALNLRERGVRLAVLGAGEAGRRDQVNAWTGVALSLIRAGIPAVVGMQYPIRDTHATAFYHSFYRALVAGQPIDAAVTDGRLAILNRSGEDERDWGVPVLTMRSLEGVLFPQAPPEPSPPKPPPPSKPPRPVNPFIYGGPIKDQRYFFGRATETRRVLHRLAKGQSVSIVGPRRIGKTSFLFHLSDPQVRAAHGLGDEIMFVYADCQEMSSLTEFDVYRMLLRYITTKIETIAIEAEAEKSDVYRTLLRYSTGTIPGDRSVEYGYQEVDPHFSLDQMLFVMARADIKIILLLDEFGVLASSPRADQRFFGDLRSLAMAHEALVYVTATAESLIDLQGSLGRLRDSPFFDMFWDFRLGPMQPEEARALVDGLAAMVDFEGFGEDDHAFLREIAGLHPFYLQMAASILFEEKVGRVGLGPPDYDRVRVQFDEEARSTLSTPGAG